MLRGGGIQHIETFLSFFFFFLSRDTVANAKSVNTIHLAPSIAAMACELGGCQACVTVSEVRLKGETAESEISSVLEIVYGVSRL